MAVHERPADVPDAQVLDAVRAHWWPGAEEVEHLPVGFGAHHWAASASGSRHLFVTLDALAPRRTREELEGAYAGAARLAADGLEFVLPCLAAAGGGLTVPFGHGALSVTRWHEGTSGDGPHQDEGDAAQALVVRKALASSCQFARRKLASGSRGSWKRNACRRARRWRASTIAARSRRGWAIEQTTSRRTLRGWRAAVVQATRPPQSCPTSTASRSPSARTRK